MPGPGTLLLMYLNLSECFGWKVLAQLFLNFDRKYEPVLFIVKVAGSGLLGWVQLPGPGTFRLSSFSRCVLSLNE